VFCLAAAGCAAGTADPAADEVTPITDLKSGATCPPGSQLGYESFGRDFMQSFCLRCHTAAISGAARMAPPDRNFDDLLSIRAAAHLIDQQAVVGPLISRDTMPPSDPKPTLQQRQQLGEWLACGAPENPAP
jgi:uncharacterized membrane protein